MSRNIERLAQIRNERQQIIALHNVFVVDAPSISAFAFRSSSGLGERFDELLNVGLVAHLDSSCGAVKDIQAAGKGH
jgi:hypothetical protein